MGSGEKKLSRRHCSPLAPLAAKVTSVPMPIRSTKASESVGGREDVDSTANDDPRLADFEKRMALKSTQDLGHKRHDQAFQV